MREETPRHRVTFLPSNRTVEVKPGDTLIKAARKAGIHINASCGGSGVCGKCRVVVEQGSVSGGASEKLSREEFAQGVRQACTAQVRGEVTVRIPATSGTGKGGLSTEVPQRHRARMHVYDIEELREEGIFLPPVEKYFLELPRPGQQDNMADAGRILQGIGNQYDVRGVVISLPVLRKVPEALRADDFRVTVTIANPVRSGKKYLMDVQPGNWMHRNFGLAFDIGTTSVYGILIDLNTGAVLARAGEYNGQISYGEDVISRIIQTEKPKGLDLMQELVTSTINGLIDTLLMKAKVPERAAHGGAIQREEVGSITLAGNTTMTHLLLHLDPRHIRRAPYVPVTTFLPPIRAMDLRLDLPRHAVALAYPSISSYVGGDIVAGVMGSGMYRTELVTLYIDIGTNAEIVIGNKEWLVCAACSAGPAFEGGGITHGMRAAEGAIEDFSLDPDTLEPMNLTVGNKPPVGICGSGLLVIVATFLEQGVIDQSGKFNRGLETPRLREGRSGYEFVLAWAAETGSGHDIVLNEVDIENFIRAKAAIYAGVKTLVEEVGLTIDSLEQIILAGAFGSYIDLDAAMTVGLLPEVETERVLYVGNGSLLGSWMSEMSNHIRQDVVEVVRRMTSFELSEVAHFKDQYIASHFLPHTELALFPKVKARLEREEKEKGKR